MSTSDIQVLAAFLNVLQASEDYEYACAILSVLRNRQKYTRGPLRQAVVSCYQPEGVAQVSLLLAQGQVSGAEMARSLLQDQIEDPTTGAVAFHFHWENQHWAEGQEPCALIGSSFFYRLSAGHSTGLGAWALQKNTQHPPAFT